MARLHADGWVAALRARVADGTPLLGICLGMQMLATASEENGVTDGLDLVSGRVRRLDSLGCTLRVPHVGWNDVRHVDGHTLFARIPQGTDFYFVHSFALVPVTAGDVCATTDYDGEVTAAVQRGRVFGTQFHPEKSSHAGRQVLRNFLQA
jgi:glutamine amidotransferase